MVDSELRVVETSKKAADVLPLGDPSAVVLSELTPALPTETGVEPGVKCRGPAEPNGAGPIIGFGDMARFQAGLLAVGLFFGYLLGFIGGDAGSATAGLVGEGVPESRPLWSVDWLGRGLLESVVTGVGVAVALVMLVQWMERRQWAWLREIERVVQGALVPSLRRCSLWQLACLAGLAGLGEELLFRWAIQGALESGLRRDGWLAGGWGFGSDAVAYGLAAGCAALLFGLCHAVTRAYLILASLMGLLFSAVVVGGGGLLAAILAHGLYDFLVFLMLRREEWSNRAVLGATQ